MQTWETQPYGEADFDAEAKAVLRQVEADLKAGRQQMVWPVLLKQPALDLSAISAMMRWGGFLGMLATLPMWWYIDRYVLHGMISREMPWIYWGAFAAVVVLTLLMQLLTGRLLAQQASQMRRHVQGVVHINRPQERVMV